MSAAQPQAMGAILAGGRGSRIGGAKALVSLAGRPLIDYPLAALRQVVPDVAIIAKRDTELPPLDDVPGVRIVYEPARPRHPLVGIVHALDVAAGRPVLVCAADLPFVTAAALARLAFADPQGTPAVIAFCAGRPQPLLGCYQPVAADLLRAAATEATAPVTAAVGALAPRGLELKADVLLNINSEEDLAWAEALLAQAATSRR